MGLDMYLVGRKHRHDFNKVDMEDGYRVTSNIKELELAYWRKHPNLHGYIVNTFARGEDNCEPIVLDFLDLQKILMAVENHGLPPTSGFFFGSSDGSEREEDMAVFRKAMDWLKEKDQDPNVTKTVYYQASW